MHLSERASPPFKARSKSSPRYRRLARRRRALFFERLEDRALLATIVWDGEGGDNAWGNAANWFDETNEVNNVLPGTGDDVEIRAPFAGEVISLVSGAFGTTVTLNSLRSAAGLHLQGGSHAPTSLKVTATAEIAGPMSLVSGEFGGGTWTFSDRLNLTGGNLSGGGTLIIAPNATLAIDGSLFSIDSWTIENQGTIDWVSGGINATDPLTVNNRPEALFNVRDVGTFGSGNSGRIINNEGVLRKSEGMGRSQIAMIFNNTGSVEVQSGTLAIVKGGVSSGDFSFAAGTTLELRGGDDFFDNAHTITLGEDDSIAGQGRLLIADRQITIQGSGIMDIASLEISTRAGSRLNLDLDASVPSVLLASGFLGGTGTLTVTNDMTWSGGQMADNGTTLIAAGAALTIDANSVGILHNSGHRTIDNHGAFRWLRGTINSSATGRLTLHNRAGAVFDIQSDAAASAAGSVVHNAGIVRKSGGTGRSDLRMTVHNTGTVDVQTGTLALNRGGTSTGNFSFAAGTTLELGEHDGSPHFITLSETNSMVGMGRLLVSNGDATIGGSGLMDVQKLELQGNFVDLHLDLDATVPEVLVTGGSLGGSGTLTVADHMLWSKSPMADGGTTVIGPDATLTVSGGVSINDNDSDATPTRTIDNHGSIQWLDGNIFVADLLVLRNRPGARLEIRSDATFGHRGSLINEGSLSKAAGSGKTTIDVNLTNSGTVEVLTGTLEVSPGYTQTAGMTRLAGGNLTVPGSLQFEGGVLTGAGTITGSLNNSGGTMAPGTSPGQLAITGNYTQESGGALLVEIGGLAAGSEFDQLAVGGTALLGGDLTVQLIDGFVPAVGDTFLVLSGTTTGAFGTLNLPLLPAPRIWDVETGSVVLEVVAQVPIEWDGGPAGTGTDFNDPVNWVGDVLPGPTDDAVIGPAFAAATITSASDVSINSLTSAASLSISSTWAIADASAIDNTLNLNFGSTLTGDGDLAVDNLNWNSNSTMSGAGTTTVSGTLTVGGGNKILERTLTNNGTGTMADTILGSGTFNNAGSFEIQDVAGFSGSTGTVNNSGTLTKRIVTGFGGGLSQIEWVVNNTGTITAQSGELRSSGGGISSGSFMAKDMARLRLGGSHTITLGMSDSISGAGTMEFADGTNTVGGTGTFNVTGTTEVTFGTTHFNLPVTTTNALVTAELAGSASFSVADTLQWESGTMSGAGTTSVNGTLSISGTNKSLERTLVNNGAADVPDFNFFGLGTFQNNGTLTKTIGTGQSIIPWTVNNTGTVEARTGTLRFTGSYTQTAGDTRLAGGSFAFEQTAQIQGGAFTGQGTITGNVNNSGGRVDPEQVITITGNYDQQAGGQLHVDLDGFSTGVNADLLDIQGNATLAGRLDVSLETSVGGGETVQVLRVAPGNSLSGAFTETNAGDHNLTVVHNPLDVTLQATAPANFTSLSGQKFDDTNGNGFQDPGEVGLSGWEIQLIDPATGAVLATTTTRDMDFNGDGAIDAASERGRYEFPDVPAGDYILREILQLGWHPTFPEAATERLAGAAVDGDGPDLPRHSENPSVSGDGRFVVFSSYADNLASGDTNGASDIFVLDRHTGLIERVSISTTGTQAEGGSFKPAVSDDGQVVVFQSYASNLAPGDHNHASDVFAYHRPSGRLLRLSVNLAGGGGNAGSFNPAISANGRWVAFESAADNLVPGDDNSASDVFVFDLRSALLDPGSVVLDRVSVGNSGPGNSDSHQPDISDDGRFVAFTSIADNLVPGDDNGQFDVFVFDRQTHAIERVSVANDRAEASGASVDSAISGDGRFVAFVSLADNLVEGDDNGEADVFRHDRQAPGGQRLARIGVGNDLSVSPAISGDGRFVAFASLADNLVPGDTNDVADVYLYDAELDVMTRVSRGETPTEPLAASLTPALNADGGLIVYASYADNLVAGDTNSSADIFASHRLGQHAVTLAEQEQIDGLVFGNQFRLAAVSGQKFDDRNSNGQRDTNDNGEFTEPGLDGWTIRIVDVGTGQTWEQQTRSIDLNGDDAIDPIHEQGLYEFGPLPPGQYEIFEHTEDGWMPTFPRVLLTPPPIFQSPSGPPQPAAGPDPRLFVPPPPRQVVPTPSAPIFSIPAVSAGAPEQLPILYVHGFVDDGASWADSGEYFRKLADVTGGAAPIEGSAGIETFGIQYWSTDGGNANATAAEGYAVLQTVEELANSANPFNKPSAAEKLGDFLGFLVNPENWVPQIVNPLDPSTWVIPALQYDFQSDLSDYNQNGLVKHHAVDLRDLLAESLGQPGKLQDVSQVNIVTHSAGGLDTRAMLALLAGSDERALREGVSNVIYTAPPFGGSTLDEINIAFFESASIAEMLANPWVAAVLANTDLGELIAARFIDPFVRSAYQASDFLTGAHNSVGERIDAIPTTDEIAADIQSVYDVLDSSLKIITELVPFVPTTGLSGLSQLTSGLTQRPLSPELLLTEQAVNLFINGVVKPLATIVLNYPGVPKASDDLRPYEAVHNNLEQFSPNLEVPQFVVWGEGGLLKQLRQMINPDTSGGPIAIDINLGPSPEAAFADPRLLHAFGNEDREFTDFTQLDILPGDGALSRTSAVFLTDLGGGYMTALAGFAGHTHGSIALDLQAEAKDVPGSFRNSDDDDTASVGEVLVETFLTAVTGLELSAGALVVDPEARVYRVGANTELSFAPQDREFEDLFQRRFHVTAESVEFRIALEGAEPTAWQSVNHDTYSRTFGSIAAEHGLESEERFTIEWRSVNQQGGREAIRAAAFVVDTVAPSLDQIEIVDAEAPGDLSQIARPALNELRTQLQSDQLLSRLDPADAFRIQQQQTADWFVNLDRDKTIRLQFEEPVIFEYQWNDPLMTSPRTTALGNSAAGAPELLVRERVIGEIQIPGIGVDYLSEGTHTVYFRATDRQGNQTAIQSLTIQIDNTDPQLGFNVADGTIVGPGTPLILSATDVGSGIGSASIDVPGVGALRAGAVFTLGETSLSEQIESGDEVVLTATAADRVANSATQSLAVRYDFQPPELSLDFLQPAVPLPNGRYITTLPEITIQIRAADDTAGLEGNLPVHWTMVTSAGPFSGTLDRVIVSGSVFGGAIRLPEGRNILTFQAADQMGNLGTFTLEVLRSPSQKVTLDRGDRLGGIDFGNMELGTIAGTVYHDRDNDGIKHQSEPGLRNWTVFLDTDGDGTRGDSEPATTTGPGGQYAFSGLLPGEYTVGVVTEPAWELISPESGFLTVTVGANQRSFLDLDFGFDRVVTLSGQIFDDKNANRVQDADEPGLSGRTVSIFNRDTGEIIQVQTAGIDLDGNGLISGDERGFYQVELSHGDYEIGPIEAAPIILTSPRRLEQALVPLDDEAGVATHLRNFSTSNDGRYVAFESAANAGSGIGDVLVYDRWQGELQPLGIEHQNGTVVVGGGVIGFGGQSVRQWLSPVISADGSLVVFQARSASLPEGDGTVPHLFLYYRANDQFQRISLDTVDEKTAISYDSIAASGDGRVIVAEMAHVVQIPPLVGIPGRTVIGKGVVIYDLDDPDNPQFFVGANPSISADGRYVRYSHEGNLFELDRLTSQTTTILEHNGEWDEIESAGFSADGRTFVVQVTHLEQVSSTFSSTQFEGTTSLLVVQRDAALRETAFSSPAAATFSPFGSSRSVPDFEAAISADGRVVAFASQAGDAVENDTNGKQDVFLYYRASRTHERISVRNGGGEANGDSSAAAFVGTSRSVVFFSQADNLTRSPVPEDTLGFYVHSVGRFAGALPAGSSISNLNFGSYEPARTVRGLVFDDKDGDGARDEEDLGLEGWTVQLARGGGVQATTTTDAFGRFQFGSVASGLYTVTLVRPQDWSAVGPASQSVLIPLLDPATELQFANQALVTISGVAFEDQSGNHLQDGGEAGLSGRTIQAVNYATGEVVSQTTGTSGQYEFRLSPGHYEVRELLPPAGWLHTSPRPTERVSLPAEALSNFSVSDNGRIVVFEKPTQDIVIYDRWLDQIRHLGISQFENLFGFAPDLKPVVSGDGRYIAFQSNSSALVPGNSSHDLHVLVYDLQTDVIDVIGPGTNPDINFDGNVVVFESGDSSDTQVYAYDRTADELELLSRNAAGEPSFFGGGSPSISDSGRFVAFHSADLIDDTFGLYVYDRQFDQVRYVEGSEDSGAPVISGTYGTQDRIVAISEDGIRIHRAFSGETTQITVPLASDILSVSDNGQFITFASSASTLVSGDTNAQPDVFVYDGATGTIQRTSIRTDGLQASGASASAVISGDGRWVIFESEASNLVDEPLPALHAPFYVHAVQAAIDLALQSGATQQVNFASRQVGGSTLPGNYTAIVLPGSTVAIPTTGISGSVAVLERAQLTGSGLISGDLFNRGRVGPGSSPGSLLIGGDFEQEAAGELMIEIGGRQAGEEYDQLVVAGSATLAGTLKIVFLDGFVPRPGDTFEVLQADSISGQFDEILVEGLPPDLRADFDPATGTIDVTWTTPPAAALQIDAPNQAVRGQPLEFVLAVEPPGQYRYEIDWDGDGTVDEVHQATETLRLTRIYRAAGEFQVSVAISTLDESASALATHDVEIHAVLLLDGKLYVGGTAGSDKIQFQKKKKAPQVMVQINKTKFGPFADAELDELVAYGHEGNDQITVPGSIKKPARLDGGPGNDTLVGGPLQNLLIGGSGNDKLRGGKAENILVGNSGNDQLLGNKARDLIIGGLGRDQLHGAAGEDILIGGTTSHDEEDEALLAILAEWNARRALDVRIANLTDGSGTSDRANGDYFLKLGETVLDDDEKDSLFGQEGDDWLFGAGDLIQGAGRKDRVLR